MKIAVASGKGGTGKTTFSVNLAYFLKSIGKKVNLLDCDVENPNDALFLNFEINEELSVKVAKPAWDSTKCIHCGKCAKICAYNAIAKVKDQILIFNELCHSCQACSYLCPSGALSESEKEIGKIRISKGDFFFADGILNIGESLAPAIIEKLKELISDTKDTVSILDVSPGTACPVVKAIEDVDLLILVTEPSPFGLNDLSLALKLASKLSIPSAVLINRSNENDRIIVDYCKKVKVPIIGKIPFNYEYAKAYSKGKVLIKEFYCLNKLFSDIYNNFNQAKVPITVNEIDEIKLDTIPEKVFSENLPSPKEIVFISGKGGTGKTSIASSFSKLMQNKIMADLDVDAANMHILIDTKTFAQSDYIGSKKYEINVSLCSKCGLCKQLCKFNAVKKENENFLINETSCEGCGFCFHVCPSNAISFKDAYTGKSYMSNSKYGLISHAKLGVGEENSGKLVSYVRKNANTLASDYKKENILSDGPPGTGCPVISSLSGADYAIIVTEASKSGFHDMKRVSKLCNYFGVKSFLIINKYDLNQTVTMDLINFANDNGIKFLGKIPFDKNVNDALMNYQDVLSYDKGFAKEKIKDIYENFLNYI